MKPIKATERAIHSQPPSPGRDEAIPIRGVIKRVAKVLFSFAQRFNDSFCYREWLFSSSTCWRACSPARRARDVSSNKSGK